MRNVRRLATILLAIASGVAVAAGLALAWGAQAPKVSCLVLKRDVIAGSPLVLADVLVESAPLSTALDGSLLPPSALAKGSPGRAAHDLKAGQLLQRADVVGAASDYRLVLVQVASAPAVSPGDRVDLLLVSGAGPELQVARFAASVQVAQAVSGGLILEVAPSQVAAFVYASVSQHLVAVAGAGAPASEPPVSSLAEAEAATAG